MIVLYFIKDGPNNYIFSKIYFFTKITEQDKCKYQQQPFFFCFSFFFLVILVVGTYTGMKLCLFKKVHLLLFVLDRS